MSKRHTEPAAKHVGIWIRVSTENQVQGDSPEHHERRARAYAESRDWKVREVYRLEAVSGKSVMGHREAERMLKDIRRGHVTALIFSKLARLARNTKELLDFSDIFRENDADLVSLQEAIDTSTPAGRLFYTMIAAMAQWEREEISERVAASVPIRAKLGKPLGGAAPFGYQWENRELVPDPKEAPVRKLLYEMFIEHRRKKTVARFLNEAGHRTRNGSHFSDTTVDRLIRDTTAKGLRRANYTRSTGDKKHWELKDESEWVHSEVEPIISEELWDQANAILAGNKKGRRPAKKAVHLFSGVLFCKCGSKMYVPTSSPKYVCWTCRNKIEADALEDVFREQLHEFAFQPEDLIEAKARADDTVREKMELLAVLEDEEKKVTKGMDRIRELFLGEKISKDGFAREYGPLEERLGQVQDQIPDLQGEIDFFKIQLLSQDEILSESQDLASRWSDLDRDEKRQIIENVTERIEVGDTDVEIELCRLPFLRKTAVEGQRDVRGSSRRRG